MRKTLWIAIIFSICAVLIMGICAVGAQNNQEKPNAESAYSDSENTGNSVNYDELLNKKDWARVNSDTGVNERFDYYKKKDFEPHMKPMDMTPVRFYVQDEHDGTYTLTLTIKNLSDRPWPAGGYDLVCKRGSDYLVEGSGPRWTINENVARGETTQIQATLNQYVRNGRMVFYVLDGQNSFYGFYIRL